MENHSHGEKNGNQAGTMCCIVLRDAEEGKTKNIIYKKFDQTKNINLK